MLRNFADVQQAIGARDDFDKRAELSQTSNGAKEVLPTSAVAVRSRMICNALLAEASSFESHIHVARVFNVNLHASLLDDGTNHLATGPDDVTNLVHRNLQSVNSRRKARNFLAGSSQIPQTSCRGCATVHAAPGPELHA